MTAQPESLAAKQPIFLDYNSSTPLAPLVAKQMIAQISSGWFGNPSSTHSFGEKSSALVDRARNQAAAFFQCQPSQIVFTSGATEGLNMIIKGVMAAGAGGRNGLLISTVEHAAVEAIAEFLEKSSGVTVFRCPVDGAGILNLAAFRSLLENQQIGLVSVIYANAEIGAVQPIEKILRITRSTAPSTLVHVDASQAVGKVEMDFTGGAPDFVTVAGHKIYGPKGVGCCFVADRKHIQPLLHGGGQEQGLRGGTENVLLISALGKALELISGSGTTEAARHMGAMRDRLLHTILRVLERKNVPQYANRIRVNSSTRGLPNTLSISFEGLAGQEIARRCATVRHCHSPIPSNPRSMPLRPQRVAFSTGSACHSKQTAVTGTLAACGISPAFARGTIRLSTGIPSTVEEMTEAAEVIVSVVLDMWQSKDTFQ